MKSIISKPLLFLLLIVLSGCSNDDATENGLSTMEIEELNDQLENLYDLMHTPGSGGTSSNIDLGQKGFDLFTDLIVSDMAVHHNQFFQGIDPLNHSFFYITEYLTSTDFNQISNDQVWTYYYNIVKGANSIISNIQSEPIARLNTSAEQILGQSLAMRAYAYFYLTQYMSNDYVPSAPILPIYTEPSLSYAPKSSTEEVFELIESDLNKAIELLDNYQRPSKQHINKHVAQTLLVYALSAQRDGSRQQEIVDLCNKIITGSGARFMNRQEVLEGFNSVSIPGWIWGVDITPDMGLSQNSWWGHVDYFSYGLAFTPETKRINEKLFNLIQSTDIRKAHIVPLAGVVYMLSTKFYDEEQVPSGSSEIVKADYLYMRIAELYFLKAEALVKMGRDAEARAAIGQVLSERLLDISYLDTLSGEALLDEIFLQTRIEFWGEGKTYLALKRNEMTTGMRGELNIGSSFIGQTFQHNDERLTFEIPASEIQNNPFINDQN